MKRFLLASAVALAFSAPAAHAAIGSDFNAGSQGWQVVDFSNPNLFADATGQLHGQLACQRRCQWRLYRL
jgi:hypothetical protein